MIRPLYFANVSADGIRVTARRNTHHRVGGSTLSLATTPVPRSTSLTCGPTMLVRTVLEIFSVLFQRTHSHIHSLFAW